MITVKLNRTGGNTNTNPAASSSKRDAQIGGVRLRTNGLLIICEESRTKTVKKVRASEVAYIYQGPKQQKSYFLVRSTLFILVGGPNPPKK